MKNVLVTGGAGFIGSNFVRHLLHAAHDVHVVNLDALTYAGSLENLRDLPDEGRHTFVEGDICDRALVHDLLRRYRVDTIVHLAAESHVDRSILGPEPFIHTNVQGTFVLLEAARQYWLEEGAFASGETHFHHVSTDEVYGSLGPHDPPFSETTTYAPSSPYAASKAASDHLVRAYHRTYALPITISNCSNNYGPCQFPEKLIPLTITNAHAGRPLPVYGDGQQIRDWLFVQDHCEAILLILRKGRVGETYNIGGENQPANLDIVQAICDQMDAKEPEHAPHRALIQFVTDRPGHDRRYDMDTTKIRRELGWRPQHSLDDGLRETVDWFLSHPEWIKAIREQKDYQRWMEKQYGQG
ncbi:MAG TPA: dTDP-glucose 4,6-dehydratase [Anaerolineales bacterium]|nr:dTDP-glucose 4,6-dehydratase [Anaerolineales bacterium]